MFTIYISERYLTVIKVSSLKITSMFQSWGWFDQGHNVQMSSIYYMNWKGEM
jgi:hypothetical protein